MSQYFKGKLDGVFLETPLSERDVKALDEYIKRRTAPTPEVEPVAWLNDMGTEQKLSFEPLEGAREHEALIRATHPAPPSELVKAVLDESFGVCATVIRDVCELDADNPTDPSTICINVETLERLIDEALRAELDKVK